MATQNLTEEAKSCLAEKEELLNELTEAIKTENLHEGAKKVRELRDQWNSVPRFNIEEEDELWARFDALQKEFYARRDAQYEQSKSKKEKLVYEAKQIVEMSKTDQSVNWRTLGEKQKELMEEWRNAGYAGHAHDEKLWEAFSAIRSEFYELRTKFFEERNMAQSKAKETKTALIARAQEVLDKKQWRDGSAEMKRLMEEWKAAGRASYKEDQELWDKFSAIRSAFYDEKKQFFANRQKQKEDNDATKARIVAEMRAIVEGRSRGKEAKSDVLDLASRWKATGRGTEESDGLWEEYSALRKEFWDDVDRIKAEKQERWKKGLDKEIVRKEIKLLNARNAKGDILDKLEGEVLQQYIEENQEKLAKLDVQIARLEAEIAEIEKQQGE